MIIAVPRTRGGPLADPDVSTDETLSLRKEGASRGAVVAYQLHAAIYHLSSECQRLLDRVNRPERRAWRDALGEAWLGSRYLLSLADQFLQEAPGGSQRLDRLVEQLAEPLERVQAGLKALLQFVPIEPLDELLLHDVRAVLESTLEIAAAGRGSRLPVRGPAHRHPSADAAGPARLLIVDDDAQQRKTLSRILASLGYEVAVAESGQQALEATQRALPDLILSDITMPGMDGYELLARLKRDEATSHIPVIMLSGLDDTQSVVRCIEQGAEDHITKPFELVLLKARLRAALDRKRSRDVDLERLRKVAELSAAAEAVENEAYVPGMLQSLATQDDEMGRLARVFDRMVSGLRLRQDRLEHRLQTLRREIRQSRTSLRGPGAVAVSADSPFVIGELVANRYEINGELGKGGMGMVYLAKDLELSEDIAIKVVRRDLVSRDPTLVDRLKTEIRLARRISHRNVVRAHDWGEWRGEYYITMEYVRGISISDLLDDRMRLSVESTIAVGTQLADALAVAHEQGIIHRDIKPANLLVDDAGVLKVMDFGIARLATDGDGLTNAGALIGTPAYMSPEQLLRGDIDARSDLFATGAVLYECASGRPAFEGDTPPEIIASILSGRIRSLSEFVPHAPRGLISVIERLLRRDPRDRPVSARALAEELNQIGQAAHV